MARSTSLLILLAALVIQVVLAYSGSSPYFIVNEGRFLGTGDTPHVFPPIDVEAQLLSPRSRGIHWFIEKTQGGYTIKESKYENAYSLIVEDGQPYFSAVKHAGTWAVNPADGRFYTIGLPNKDLLLTAEGDVATLRPADGSREQKWTLQELDSYRNLYPNRFQHIL